VARAKASIAASNKVPAVEFRREDVEVWAHSSCEPKQARRTEGKRRADPHRGGSALVCRFIGLEAPCPL
jgi:hypothetical protein